MIADGTATVPGSSRARSGWTLVLLVLLAAVTWWLVGALPELLSRLIDALRGSPAAFIGLVEGTPVLALPLTGMSLGTLGVNSLLAGTLAGFSGRLATKERRLLAAGATLAGVLLALLVVLVSAAGAPESGGFPFGSGYGRGITTGAVLAAVLGWGLGTAALSGSVGTGMALGAVAGALPVWLFGVSLSMVVDLESLGPDDLDWTRWVGTAVLVLALVTVGLRPPSRLGWWPLVVVLSWVSVSAVVLVSFLLAGMSGDVWSDTWRGLLAQAREVHLWLVPVVVAVVIAVLRDRRRPA